MDGGLSLSARRGFKRGNFTSLREKRKRGRCEDAWDEEAEKVRGACRPDGRDSVSGKKRDKEPATWEHR